MLSRIVLISSTFAFAFIILAVSVLHSCSIKVFSASPKATPTTVENEAVSEVSYVFAYTGAILPDSPFWYLKALRDKVWLGITTNAMRKAELSLLFADKRLMAANLLFMKNKPSLALSTLTKAEKYLENAQRLESIERGKGADTKSFLITLNKASVGHMSEIKKIILIAPEDIRPEVTKVENYAVNVYNSSKNALESLGIVPANNPFARD